MKDIRGVIVVEGDMVAISLLDGTLRVGKVKEASADPIKVEAGKDLITVDLARVLVIPTFYAEVFPSD